MKEIVFACPKVLHRRLRLPTSMEWGFPAIVVGRGQTKKLWTLESLYWRSVFGLRPLLDDGGAKGQSVKNFAGKMKRYQLERGWLKFCWKAV